MEFCFTLKVAINNGPAKTGPVPMPIENRHLKFGIIRTKNTD